MSDGMWVDRATLDGWQRERDELATYARTANQRCDALRVQLAEAMMERDKMKADLLKALQHGMAAIMHAERVRAEAVPLDPADRHPCGAWYCKGGCDGCEDCTMDHGRRE